MSNGSSDNVLSLLLLALILALFSLSSRSMGRFIKPFFQKECWNYYLGLLHRSRKLSLSLWTTLYGCFYKKIDMNRLWPHKFETLIVCHRSGFSVPQGKIEQDLLLQSIRYGSRRTEGRQRKDRNSSISQ